MKKNLIIVALTLASTSTFAYEVSTHAMLTWNAYLTSRLSTDANLKRDLGVDWYLVDESDPAALYDRNFGSTIPFASTYFDRNQGILTSRNADGFEQRIMSVVSKRDLTIPGWLMRGVVREDDSGGRLTSGEGEPLNDPYGNFNRWCNHFFDPTQPAGSRLATFPLCSPLRDAANWAAGTTDLFGAPGSTDAGRRNHFTIKDARESLYRAVTGRSTDGSNAGASMPDASFSERKAYYATMFRALGDVLHLNQDMAQPQHTRNEPHAGYGYGTPIYEKYIDSRVQGKPVFSYNLASKVGVQPIQFAPTQATSLGSYAEYWFKGDGKGLSEYSNLNFFTPSNNFGSSHYQSPPPDKPSAFGHAQVVSPYGTVTSYLTYNGNRVSTEGALARFLPAGYPGTYTMDFNVFDDMAASLLPKAVASSAGLLNFFFRGKLQVDLPDEGVYGIADHAQTTVANSDLTTNNTGFKKIKLKLSAPQTGYDDQPQQFGGGVILAVLKFRRNICFNNDGGGNFDLSGMDALDSGTRSDTCRTHDDEVVVSNPANGGATITPGSTPTELTFDFQKALPVNATDVKLQVVYRGMLGNEPDAVVVATQDVAEPSFFSYMNASDYWSIQTSGGVKVYTRDAVNADQALLQAVTPVSCIDTSVVPNQLKSSCLNAFDINVGFKIGNGVTVQANALPVRRFIRFAVLGNAGASTSMAQMATNSCYPHDPMQADSMEWQDGPSAAGDNTPYTIYPDVSKVRGVYQWDGTSCVGNASATLPGTPDNRDDPGVMTELPSDNKSPWPVQIDGWL